MQRIISKQSFDTGNELCACFINWQMDWTEIMQNVNVIGID
jgi:hypothetical protein